MPVCTVMAMITVQAHVPRSTAHGWTTIHGWTTVGPPISFQEHEATLSSTLPPHEAPQEVWIESPEYTNHLRVTVLITELVTELITEAITEAINSHLSSERRGMPTTNGSGSELGEQTTNSPSGAMLSLSDSTAMGGANTSIGITTILPSRYSRNPTTKPDWYLLKFLLIILTILIFAIVFMAVR